MNSLKKMIKK